MLKLSDVKDSYKYIVTAQGPTGIVLTYLLKEKYGEEWVRQNVLAVEAQPEVGGLPKTHPKNGDEAASWFHINELKLYNTVEGRKQFELIKHYVMDFAKSFGFEFKHDPNNIRMHFQCKEIPQKLYHDYTTRALAHLENWVKTKGDAYLSEVFEDFNKKEVERLNIRLKSDKKLANILEGIKPEELIQFFMQTAFHWSVYGLDYNEVSAVHALNHNSCDAGTVLSVTGTEMVNGKLEKRGGMGALFKKIAQETDFAVICNARVKKIHLNPTFSGVKISTPEGEKTVYGATILNAIPPHFFNKKTAGENYVESNLPEEMIEAAGDLARGNMEKLIIPLREDYLASLKAKGLKTNDHLECGYVDENGKLVNQFVMVDAGGWGTLAPLFGGKKGAEFVELEKLKPGEGTKAALEFSLRLIEMDPLFADIRKNIIYDEVKLTTNKTNPNALGSWATTPVGKGDSRQKWGRRLWHSLVNAGEACPPSKIIGPDKNAGSKKNEAGSSHAIWNKIKYFFETIKLNYNISRNIISENEKSIYDDLQGASLANTQTHIIGALLTGRKAVYVAMDEMEKETKNMTFMPETKIQHIYRVNAIPAFSPKAESLAMA